MFNKKYKILKYIGITNISLRFTKTESLIPFLDEVNFKLPNNVVYVKLEKNRTIKVLDDKLTQAILEAYSEVFIDETEVLSSISSDIELSATLKKEKEAFEKEKEAFEKEKEAFEKEKEAFEKEKEAFEKEKGK